MPAGRSKSHDRESAREAFRSRPAAFDASVDVTGPAGASGHAGQDRRRKKIVLPEQAIRPLPDCGGSFCIPANLE